MRQATMAALAAVGLGVCAWALAEDQPKANFEIISCTPVLEDGAVVKAGEKLAVTLTYSTGPKTSLDAWRTIAWAQFVPTSAGKAESWTLKPNEKDPAWASYDFPGSEWKWRKTEPGVTGAVLTYELDTTGWVEGDYRLSTGCLFRMRENPEAKPVDTYRNGSFYFSVVAADG